jgi:tetratricopeptide (TPR) repeat protein
LNSHTNAQETIVFDYYDALEKYENKVYEKALSKFDTLSNLDYNNKEDYCKQIKYWSKYWKACIYYNLSIDKIQQIRPIAEVKQSLIIANENFKEAKKISAKSPKNNEYNKDGLFIAFCNLGEAGSCYCLGKLTLEERRMKATEYSEDITSYLKNAQVYFQSSLDLCKDVRENIKNNNVNIDIKFKTFYTEASSYFEIGKIELDKKQNKIKKDLSNNKTSYTINFTSAKSSFEKAIEIIPNDEYAWIGKGNCSFELKDYREAIQSYNFAININYHNPNVWYFKGISLHNIARYEEAIDCYMNSITISKFLNSVTNQNMNDKFSYNESRVLDDIIGNYLKIKLTEADILNDIGNALYNLRLYDEALKKYEKSLELSNGKYSSHDYKKYRYLLNKTWCLVALDRGKAALKDLEDDILNKYEDELEGFKKDIPNDLDKVPTEIRLCLLIALYLKGFILFKNKNTHSLKYVEKAIDINDRYHLNNYYPLYLQALIYNNEKKSKEAGKILDNLIELNDKFAEAYVAKAESLLLLNKKQEAAKQLNKAIEIAPNLGSAHALLSKIDSISTDGGPKFLQFWQASKKRSILAILLAIGAIVLVAIPINELRGEQMSEAVFGIVVVLVGLIAAVILLPDIGKVKVGNILEFDVIQESQPGAKLKLDLEKPFIPLKDRLNLQI